MIYALQLPDISRFRQPLLRKINLPLGAYTLEARVGMMEPVTLKFEVTDLELEDPAPLEIDLR